MQCTNYLFRLKKGRYNKDSPPKTNINRVWDVHIIHPNARLGSSGKPNNVKAITIASGYDPIPPFVAAILKVAKINPIKTAPIDTLPRSFIANVVM